MGQDVKLSSGQNSVVQIAIWKPPALYVAGHFATEPFHSECPVYPNGSHVRNAISNMEEGVYREGAGR